MDKKGIESRGMVLKTFLKWVGGAFIALLIIGAVFGGSDDEASSTKEKAAGDQEAVVEADTVYQLNDVVPYKDKLEYTVTHAESMDVIGDPNFFGKVASDGATFVAVHLTIKNVSNEPIGMFSYPSVKLVDGNGVKYSTDIDASGSYATVHDTNSKAMSDLNPGISVTDSDVYEISKEAYEQNEWYVEIGKEKVKIK